MLSRTFERPPVTDRPAEDRSYEPIALWMGVRAAASAAL